MNYCRKLQEIRVVVSKELELLRSKLRSVDESIIVMLAERMTISKCIGSLKKDLKLKIEQPDRWRGKARMVFSCC
jgi:chorismate mutase